MRVNQLQELMGDKINVTWRSFLLRTEAKTSTLEKFTEYTRSWERPAEAAPEANFTTPWASGAEPPSSSLPAQVAWKASALFGDEAQEKYHEALLTAYFTDNRTISDWDVLIDVAVETGLDREEFTIRLDESKQHLAGWVIDEHNSAINSGITAVPTVVIGDVLPVPGAQDIETYERLINRFIERRAQVQQATSDRSGDNDA